MPPGLRSSIIICTMDRPDDLGRALQSLQSQTLRPDEVIIVDASRDDRLQATIPEAFPSLSIRYLYTRPPGLTRQRNIGIRESTGDVLLFLDDDVILEPEYIERVAAAFACDTEGKIWAVLGRITNFQPIRSSTLSRIKGLVLSLLQRIFMLPRLGPGRFQLSGFPTVPHHIETPRYVECLSGCAMSFRRNVFAEVAFDENLVGPPYMDDVAVARQVGRHALVRYEPGARLRHMYSPLARQGEYLRQRHLVVNHYYLAGKNRQRTASQRAAFWWSVFGLAVLHTVAGRWHSLRGVVSGTVAVLSGSNSGSREPC